MKKHRPMMLIALSLVTCLAIAGTALASPKSTKQSTPCPSTISTTQATTTCSTCPATTNTTRCTCPSPAKTTCSTATTVKPAKAAEKSMSAKSNFGTITGHAQLGSGSSSTGLAHIHLRLLDANGKFVRAAQSKKDGSFVFKNVKPGDYTLTAWSKCYKKVTKTVTGVQKGKTVTVTINLEKK